jgi:alkaline phosphatase D
LFSFIEANRVAGVLLISGDRHGARGFRIPRPSGFNFHEFEAASLGGRSGPEVFAKDRTNQFYGIARKYAFGEFTIDATLADPTVEFRLIGDDGTIIHEMKLTRRELTPAGK